MLKSDLEFIKKVLSERLVSSTSELEDSQTTLALVAIEGEIMKHRRLGFNDIHQKEMFDNDYYKNLDNGLVGRFNIEQSGIAGEMVYTTEWKDGSAYNRMPFYEMDTTNIERIGQNFDI